MLLLGNMKVSSLWKEIPTPDNSKNHLPPSLLLAILFLLLLLLQCYHHCCGHALDMPVHQLGQCFRTFLNAAHNLNLLLDVGISFLCLCQHSGRSYYVFRVFVPPSVCVLQTNIVSKISWIFVDGIWPNFDRTLGHGWTLHILGSNSQSSRSRWSQICPKMHFLAL